MIYTMHKPNNILADVFIFFTAVGLSVVNENQRKKPTRIKQFHSDIKKKKQQEYIVNTEKSDISGRCELS